MRYIKGIFIISLLSGFGVFSQEGVVTKADKRYQSYAYVDAQKTYERMAKKGKTSAELFKRLGNSYYFNSEFEKAKHWYEQLFLSDSLSKEPEYYYRYSQTLRSLGEYSKADEYMASFSQKNPSDRRSKLFVSNRDYLDQIKSNSGRYRIEDPGFNSKFSEFGVGLLSDQVVFSSARDTGRVSKRIHRWTGFSFTNLYVVDSLGVVKPFSKVINTKYNESTPVFTKDGTTMYFTRNNFKGGKASRNSNCIILLKLYKSTKTSEGTWSEAIELPFNSDEYSVAHPALSQDEKTLYFASDMPGSLGESDLYRVSIDGDSYGLPESLGEKINTEGKESFPFIDSDNRFYFSSDGRPGLGGMDVYVTRLDDPKSKVFNLGEPVNSRSDDFNYVVSKDSKGYFSTNRVGMGGDDIYKFEELTSLEIDCKQTVVGVVRDKESGDILSDATVILFDSKLNELSRVVSNSRGEYAFDTLDCESHYVLKSEKQEYNPGESSFDTPEEKGQTKTSIVMKAKEKLPEVKVGDDLTETLALNPIYYDLGKANIRVDSEAELEKVLKILGQFENMRIEIRSHTDSRGSSKNNQSLSNRRAASAVTWLVNKGIDPSRLQSRGFGESQLINNCKNGVRCSEEEHQKNRRTEFIIVKI